VRGREPLGDGGPDLEGSPGGERAAIEGGTQRLAFEKLRDRVGNATLTAKVMDGEDVRMRQRGDGPRFALEAGEGIVISMESIRQHLDRDFPQKARILCPIDLPHPACTQRRDDLVGPEARAETDQRITRNTALRFSQRSRTS